MPVSLFWFRVMSPAHPFVFWVSVFMAVSAAFCGGVLLAIRSQACLDRTTFAMASPQPVAEAPPDWLSA